MFLFISSYSVLSLSPFLDHWGKHHKDVALILITLELFFKRIKDITPFQVFQYWLGRCCHSEELADFIPAVILPPNSMLYFFPLEWIATMDSPFYHKAASTASCRDVSAPRPPWNKRTIVPLPWSNPLQAQWVNLDLYQFDSWCKSELIHESYSGLEREYSGCAAVIEPDPL